MFVLGWFLSAVEIYLRFPFLKLHFRNPLPDADPIEFQQRGTTKNVPYNYLDITNNGVEIRTNINRHRIEFWDDIFDAYSVHWQTREFNLNSLAVKIPLLMLTLLLTSIFCCKGIKMCYQKTHNKSLPVHH